MSTHHDHGKHGNGNDMGQNDDDIFAQKMQQDFTEFSQIHDDRMTKLITFVRDKPLFSLIISLLTGCAVSWLFSSKKK